MKGTIGCHLHEPSLANCFLLVTRFVCIPAWLHMFLLLLVSYHDDFCFYIENNCFAAVIACSFNNIFIIDLVEEDGDWRKEIVPKFSKIILQSKNLFL